MNITLPGGKTPKDEFVPVPNRAAKRRWRFGGYRVTLPGVFGRPEQITKPGRSRIQRGIPGETVRGVVLTEGLKPIFVDEETGERIDMQEFKP